MIELSEIDTPLALIENIIKIGLSIKPKHDGFTLKEILSDEQFQVGQIEAIFSILIKGGKPLSSLKENKTLLSFPNFIWLNTFHSKEIYGNITFNVFENEKFKIPFEIKKWIIIMKLLEV